MIKKVLDIKYAKKQAKGYNLKVTLKKDKLKGTGLFALKNIKKGNVIAYYKFKLFKYDTQLYKNNMYAMTIYTKNGNESSTLIGDIYPGSLRPPKYNIPFWAYFSNEPSKSPKEQYSNAYLDTNLKSNYRNRSRVKEGDTMVYKLIADENIKKGEEIVWCYGEYYGREYEANC